MADDLQYEPIDGSIQESYLDSMNPALNIARGKERGVSHVNKFGENHIIDSDTTPEDIWSAGGVYVPPTANRTHQVKSSSVEDKGTLISTGTITSNEASTLIDSTATFVTDSVSVGDIVVDDTDQDHSIVLSIDSETQLTVEPWHHSEETKAGDTYRVATSAGTGAVFTHIKQGYQKDGTAITEFILMNGTTNVPTVSTYYRITRSHIHGAGSNGTNTGTITITADTDTTVTAEIAADHGQTMMAFIHVPYGKTAYVTNYYVTVYRGTKIANAMVQMQLLSNLWGNDGITIEHSAGVGASGGGFLKSFEPHKRVSQGTDIWLRCSACTDNGTEISAGLDVIFVDNE